MCHIVDWVKVRDSRSTPNPRSVSSNRPPPPRQRGDQVNRLLINLREDPRIRVWLAPVASARGTWGHGRRRPGQVEARFLQAAAANSAGNVPSRATRPGRFAFGIGRPLASRALARVA